MNIDDLEPHSVNDSYNLELKEAMKLLDEKYRAPIVMYYWQGYSTTEIAIIMDFPVDTVKTRLKRGRKKLHEYYDIKGI